MDDTILNVIRKADAVAFARVKSTNRVNVGVAHAAVVELDRDVFGTEGPTPEAHRLERPSWCVGSHALRSKRSLGGGRQPCRRRRGRCNLSCHVGSGRGWGACCERRGSEAEQKSPPIR